MQMQPRAPARYHQAMLANGAKWLLTDAGGVVNTRTDGQGYTDFLTTATLGTFYLTRPLTDFFGGPIAASTDIFLVDALARVLTAANTGDRCLVGTSDNADPTAGGALYDVGGFRYQTGTTGDVFMETETGTVSATTQTIDRVEYPQRIHIGRTAQGSYGYGRQDQAYVNTRAQGAPVPRAYVPTHLCVVIKNNAAAIQTLRVVAGFHIPSPLTSLEITARS